MAVTPCQPCGLARQLPVFGKTTMYLGSATVAMDQFRFELFVDKQPHSPMMIGIP